MQDFKFDGNWVDLATLGVAALYAAIRAYRTKNICFEGFAVELSYGLSLFPMLLLSGTVVSTSAIQVLMGSNKLVISLAGLIAFIVIVKRTFERPATKAELDN